METVLYRDASTAQQIDAAVWLADRGHGRAPIIIETTENESENPLRVFTMEELLAARQAIEVLEQGEAAPPTP